MRGRAAGGEAEGREEGDVPLSEIVNMQLPVMYTFPVTKKDKLPERQKQLV